MTHCMTRLRFVLGDPARVNGPALKAITGVLGGGAGDNQCQVIIGNTVSHAYREVLPSPVPGRCGQTPLPEGFAGWSLRCMGAAIRRPDRHHVPSSRPSSAAPCSSCWPWCWR